MFNKFKQLIAPLRYWKELPLAELQDTPAKIQISGARIPPIVYQTWEDRFFGKSHRAEILRFRELNPEHEFILFNREQRLEYIKQSWGSHPIYEIYKNSVFGPMKADIFRYCLLADRGGFYFDISKGVSIPLKQFYGPQSEALITAEPHENPEMPNPLAVPRLQNPEKLLLQWGFGFAPKHPILTKVIENICAAYPSYKNKVFESPKEAIRNLTGPIMFTKSVHDVLAAGDLPNIVQAGIDFNGYGIFALKGSKVRYMTAPAYTHAKNSKIVL
jgi:mannosyltransferase OCH1-like enzyme